FLEIYIPLCKSVEIRVNPWPFNYSFKSYLVDSSQWMLRGGLSLTSFGLSLRHINNSHGTSTEPDHCKWFRRRFPS
ncbi:MAG: hypothetical protein FWH41_09755, partial [Treponema sp.]|nr:hypothetical protein [Treponema sp.]